MKQTYHPQPSGDIVPSDPESSVFRFIIVAARRARQLQMGARRLLPGTSKRDTVCAMEEVRRGLVDYENRATDKGRD